jgi:hypothetical protein
MLCSALTDAAPDATWTNLQSHYAAECVGDSKFFAADDAFTFYQSEREEGSLKF